jgi:hypothetical protein
MNRVLLDIAHTFLYLTFITATIGLVWYMSTAKWWLFLLGRAIVSELASTAVIFGFVAYLVTFPHTTPTYVAVIIYGMEAAVHSLLAWALIKSAGIAKKLKIKQEGK